MEKAIKEFERIFTERILHYKNFNSFGEDSSRYDFFNALMNVYDLKSYQFQLEFPIPVNQFENKIKKRRQKDKNLILKKVEQKEKKYRMVILY